MKHPLRFPSPSAQHRLPLLALLAISLVPTLYSLCSAQGLDRIMRRNGIDSGKITNVSVLAVTISKGGVENKVPVEEIRSIDFSGEPTELSSIRKNAGAGRYREALAKLKDLDSEKVDRKEILQEIEYLSVLSKARMALAGQGDLERASGEVSNFLSKHRTSYHVPAVIELYGDVLSAGTKYSEARAQYAKLGKAPSPFFKARSALLTGRVLQEEGKHAEAVAQFDISLQAAKGNAAAESQMTEALLHRAVSQAATGEGEQSTDAIKQLISQTKPEDTELLARSYNALGDCFLRSDDPKSARLAFLHVDLLFHQAGTEHAKALYELSKLWKVLGQETRSRDALERLQREYPESRWARK